MKRALRTILPAQEYDDHGKFLPATKKQILNT